jgi:hypothetical protein
MYSSVPNEWLLLQYLSPTKILIGLKEIAASYPLDTLPIKISSLRTHDLKLFGEGRQAALFCYGMSQVLGVDIAFAQAESQDYDFIARYESDGTLQFVPVQLKEWVPEFLNPTTSLQNEIDKLKKYVDSKNLCVVFFCNRETTIRLSELKFPVGSLGSIWFFGATDPSRNNWILIGDLLSQNAQFYEFSYPQQQL